MNFRSRFVRSWLFRWHHKLSKPVHTSSLNHDDKVKSEISCLCSSKSLLCLKRLQKGCSTVHNKSWQNCCQRCYSCQESAACLLLMKIDIVPHFKLPPCYAFDKKRHCSQFQNLNLPRAKISSDLSHRKDGQVMLKCSGSNVNSEKKPHTCIGVRV